MVGENTSPLRARGRQDCGFLLETQSWLPPLQSGNALHIRVVTFILSLLLLQHSHCTCTTHRRVLSIMHTRCVPSLLAMLASRLGRKGFSLWKALLPNPTCGAAAPGVRHQDLIPPGEQERAAGGQLGAGCRREVVRRQSESWRQKGCTSLDVGQYQGLVGGSKGSGL